ncbi:MAG: DUF362 domain-containing protein [Clostridia bacterium]|nr:DUF362 domain-containing protein [Lachnospiraceae bacterium]NCC01608.1 DUF362 domain-containing protein [Clostridia bacterium]NCD02365.1 DUF362 domain-containing protein [Clostridia bacterium]
MKSQVILLTCKDYDETRIYEELKWGIESLGGVGHFVRTDERILLKPNLLRKADIDSAVVTHPLVVSAVARILQEAGCNHITYGDSAGVGSTEKIARGCGLTGEMEKLGIPLDNFADCVLADYPEGKAAKRFHMAKAVVKTDALINISKMKTHQLERMTGAVKNMYGCIQGLHKAKGHTKYSNAESFARMLIDLNKFVNPKLYVMDGITGMEGNGPASGTPVDMGVLLLSTDPVALDSVCCALMNLKPELVPTNVQGEKMGLGVWREEDIEVLTRDGILTTSQVGKNYGKQDYDVNRGREVRRIWRQLRWLSRHFQRKPYIVESQCIRCGICVEACPVEGKAIHLDKPNAPVYDYKKCIACFCCQEMCPQKAIQVK